MKPTQILLFLFSLLLMTSFYIEHDQYYALGTKRCLLRKTIIKEGALTLIALHDNENTAVDAFHNWTDELNINLLELHQRDDRYLQIQYRGINYEIDPNMIFTPSGIAKTLSRNRLKIPAEIPLLVKSFADSLLSLFIDPEHKKYVVAIHNNSAENFSILSYRDSSKAYELFIAPAEDIDDFFIVTDSSDFAYFRNMQLNVVWQNKQIEDDGSLSVYCQQRDIPYINIEAEHGHLAKQTEMIKMVYDLIREKEMRRLSN